jgi:protein SCO1
MATMTSLQITNNQSTLNAASIAKAGYQSSASRRFVRRFVLSIALCAPFLLTLSACKNNPEGIKFNNTDVTGADFARDFELTDHDGKARTLASYKGKVVVVFFGFLNCPDVCPGALAEWGGVLEKLGDDGKKVQILFITVDPERDTPAALKNYVTAFNKSFVGLYGDIPTTVATAKNFKVIFNKVPRPGQTAYTMDHTAASFVFDAGGKLRLYVRHGQPLEALVADVKTVIKNPIGQSQ